MVNFCRVWKVPWRRRRRRLFGIILHYTTIKAWRFCYLKTKPNQCRWKIALSSTAVTFTKLWSASQGIRRTGRSFSCCTVANQTPWYPQQQQLPVDRMSIETPAILQSCSWGVFRRTTYTWFRWKIARQDGAGARCTELHPTHPPSSSPSAPYLCHVLCVFYGTADPLLCCLSRLIYCRLFYYYFYFIFLNLYFWRWLCHL